jgi:hypothetical protein
MPHTTRSENIRRSRSCSHRLTPLTLIITIDEGPHLDHIRIHAKNPRQSPSNKAHAHYQSDAMLI